MTSRIALQSPAAIVLMPPFPWNTASTISESCMVKLRAAEAVLKSALDCIHNPYRAASDSSVERARCVATATDANMALDLSDRPMLPQRINFIDLLAEACAKPELRRIDELIKLNRSVFRNREVFSKNSLGWHDVRYYSWRVVAIEMQSLCMVNFKYSSLYRLLRVLGIYVNFIFVHPFLDENGRSARRLLSLLLDKHQIWSGSELPTTFLIRRDRKRHNAVLCNFAAARNWTPLLEYFSDLLCAAAELAVLLQCQLGRREP